MPLFNLAFYAFNPSGLIGAAGSSFTWTGPATATGRAAVTDTEAGIQGQTLDDDSAGGETARATVTLGANTSTNSSADAEIVWSVRDNTTGQTFRVAQFDVEQGNASGLYTLSEQPLVAGRSYTVVEQNTNPDVTDPDIAFTYADHVAAFAANTVSGTTGDDSIGAAYAGDPEGDRVDDATGAGPGGLGDVIDAGAGSDTVQGGAGNDTIWGDAAGETPGAGAAAGSLRLDGANVAPGTETAAPDSAAIGDSVIYNNVATLADGTVVAARLIVVDKSDPNLQLDLASGIPGGEIILNNGSNAAMQGQTATIRMEFFDQATGEPLTLSGTTTFNDLDSNGGTNQEAVTLNAGMFTGFSTAADTNLVTAPAAGTVTAFGSQANDPQDEPAWFSGNFADRDSIEFTLTTRSTRSGFSLNGEVISNPVTVDFPAAGDDSLDGGAGDDAIFGQAGNDTLTGGAGDDTLSGGDGNDVLAVGSGDTAFGGDGDDRFTIDGSALDGRGIVIEGGEGGETLGDTLDFNGLLDKGSVVYTNPDDNAGGLSGTAFLTDGSLVTFRNIETVICFAEGTRLLTPQGLRAIETLRVGDEVWTADNGAQRVRWIGRRTVPAAGRLAPVRFAPGTLGNDRALVVSPQHRMMLGGWQVQLHFATPEALVAARHLVNGRDITRIEGGMVTYLHLLFDRHEIVFAEGVASESFHPGRVGIESLEAPAREEVFALYPHLRADPMAFGPAARPALRAREAQLLAA